MRKIEEIARALATADWRKNVDEFTERDVWEAAADAYDLTNNSGRFHYDNLALAAVKAMREPSRDALTAFVDADVSVQDAAERWACAIDSIIAEAEQEGE